MARIVHLSTVHQTRDNRIYNKECKALIAAGHDVTLVIRAECDEPTTVPVVALPKPRGRIHRLLFMQAAAWRAVWAIDPEILHIHDPELIPLALLFRSMRHGTKIVYDAHEDLVTQISAKPYLAAWQRPVARLVAQVLVATADRRFDAVVAATQTVRGRFRRNRRSIVLRNFPWISDYSAESQPVAGRIVYVGDLTEERKLTLMLDAVERVRVMVPEAHLVLAGRPGNDCESTLASRVDGDAVSYLGLLKPVEVPTAIAKAQVGLVFLEPLPNYLESLPTKLFEYMASRVAYLASDFPSWRANFEKLGAGRFVNTEDIEAVASSLSSMLRDPEACHQMGERGRTAIERDMNFEEESKELLSLVCELCR